MRKAPDPNRAGNAGLSAEAFLNRPSLGTAGFENNFIVTESGAELLDKNSMLY